MIPKTGQHPDAPRQRLYSPRHPALAALLATLAVIALFILLAMG